jgi:hypothetical protein
MQRLFPVVLELTRRSGLEIAIIASSSGAITAQWLSSRLQESSQSIITQQLLTDILVASQSNKHPKIF